jgi:hypothetical protein
MSQLLRENAITKLATVTGIDAKTVATTELFAVPTGKSMVVTGIVIRVTSFTAGGKSVQAIASFGANSATYDDYLNSVTYTVTAVSKVIQDSTLDAEVPLYAAASSFRISIETGSDATTETWAIDLMGYLI